MTHPQISLSIENSNYPAFLQPVIDSISKGIKTANLRLKSVSSGNDPILESIHRDVVLNTAKLGMMNVDESKVEGVRYGVGGSHFWMSVYNCKNIWERIVMVNFENF